MAGEDGDYGDPTGLDADIILVDEVSMMDIHLAGKLLESVRSNAQIVMIGDSDQLPSVGPGAVLSEMIASARIPVVRLDRVHRSECEADKTRQSQSGVRK